MRGCTGRLASWGRGIDGCAGVWWCWGEGSEGEGVFGGEAKGRTVTYPGIAGVCGDVVCVCDAEIGWWDARRWVYGVWEALEELWARFRLRLWFDRAEKAWQQK